MSTLVVNRSFFDLAAATRRWNSLIFMTSVGHLVLLMLILVIAPFDERVVTGLNPWIKPAKFIVANTVYLLTIGWLVHYLPSSPNAKTRVSRLIATAIIVETIAITLQAARGTTSHYNLSTPINAGILGMMGVMIVINTIVVGYMCRRFWNHETSLTPQVMAGIRSGLVIFLLASLEGFVMIALHSHSVGVADGGPGLPIINWSTRGGDLRIAHFIGLHALQLLPLIGYFFSLPAIVRRIARPVSWVRAVGVLYGVASLLLFVQALRGVPLISF